MVLVRPSSQFPEKEFNGASLGQSVYPEFDEWGISLHKCGFQEMGRGL